MKQLFLVYFKNFEEIFEPKLTRIRILKDFTIIPSICNKFDEDCTNTTNVFQLEDSDGVNANNERIYALLVLYLSNVAFLLKNS